MSFQPPTDPVQPSDSEFPDTVSLIPGLSAEAHALLAGDLGDPSYRIDTFAESVDLMRRVANSRQLATLIVLKPNSEVPEPLLAFNARIDEVNDDNQTMEIDLPKGASHLVKGLTLRGSVRLQGVIVTFECETLGTRTGSVSPHGVLMTRMPFRLYRLQRRDSFRVPLPPQSGVVVTLKNGMRSLENIRALDLSCGGACVLLRAPLEVVHQGKRFARASLRLGVGTGNEQAHLVDMLVRHVRLAPPSLNKLLLTTPTTPGTKATGKTLGKTTLDSTHFRQAAMAAVGATLQPELLQLGIEFENIPAAMERQLVQLVNELGLKLATRVKDD